MSDPTSETTASLPSRFGEQEAVFSPTPGQTWCGIMTAVVLALLSLLPLLERERHGFRRTLVICFVFFFSSV